VNVFGGTECGEKRVSRRRRTGEGAAFFASLSFVGSGVVRVFDCLHLTRLRQLSETMADSAARIAEIRQALSSTGKSVSDYSARFAAGEAPEQLDARAAHHSAAEGALAADEVFQVLQDISKLSKVRMSTVDYLSS